ncbi:MAG TPA: PAS domain S-box protein [Phycisphaerales bacterium]|nr:PAS domain S-box protein [Phycisphaerales bacterium]HMP38647.1 PAS domain S-box protein [Phycisphaerales bacterium]
MTEPAAPRDRLGLAESEKVALERLALLTAAEREVFELLGLGVPPDDVARRLGRKKSTIETHIRHTGQKLGLRGIQRLTRIAILAMHAAAARTAMPSARVLDVLRAEIGRHRAARRALDEVVAATSALSDEAFFRALAQSLGEALGAEAGAILERAEVDDPTLRVIGWWTLREPAAEPPVKQIPLDRSCLGRSVTDRPRAAERPGSCPEDDLVTASQSAAQLVEPLFGAEGSLLGGIVLLGRRPLAESRSPELIVRLMGARVATELERRRSDRRLRESERRYRTLADNATDIITQLRPDGIQLYVSPAVEALLGHRPEDLVGRSAYELVHPDDIVHVGPLHGAVLANPGTPSRARFRLKHRDGALVWVESVVRAVVDPGTGRVVELLAITRDIGADQEDRERLDRSRTLLEARNRDLLDELRRHEAWWRAVVEQASDAIVVVSPDRVVRFANRRAPAAVGADMLEQIVAEDRPAAAVAIARLFPPGGLPKTGGAPSDAAGDDSPLASEVLFRCRTGSAERQREWEMRATALRVGPSIEAAVIVGLDITEESDPLRTLREQALTHRRLVESTPLGIFLHDGCEVIFANPAAARFLGHDGPERLRGVSIMDLADPAMHRTVQERVQTIIHEGATAPMLRQRLRRADGSWLHVDLVGIAGREGGRNIVQVVFSPAVTLGENGAASAPEAAIGPAAHEPEQRR